MLFPRAYVENFYEELLNPGPKVPITRNYSLFKKAVYLGHELLRLHTWGERDLEGDKPTREIPDGKAQQTKSVSADTSQTPTKPNAYPKDYSYIEETQTLHVGSGEFAPVSLEVWSYSVSGLPVVKTWLDYRKAEPNGRKSSELDKIRPASWTGEMSDELQDLLWLLEHSLELEPRCTEILNEICAGDVFFADEFPKPTADEQRAPNDDISNSDQTEMFTGEI